MLEKENNNNTRDVHCFVSPVLIEEPQAYRDGNTLETKSKNDFQPLWMSIKNRLQEKQATLQRVQQKSSREQWTGLSQRVLRPNRLLHKERERGELLKKGERSRENAGLLSFFSPLVAQHFLPVSISHLQDIQYTHTHFIRVRPLERQVEKEAHQTGPFWNRSTIFFFSTSSSSSSYMSLSLFYQDSSLIFFFFFPFSPFHLIP